jgi:IS30 family transposase
VVILTSFCHSMEEVRVGRKPMSAEIRARFFRARASGATLRQAAAAAGVSRTTGHYWLAQSGGVRPRLRRPRPALRLSLEEREAISRGLAAGWTLTAIAADLGRSTSTVSREVARNSGVNGYRAARAERLAVARTARPRAGKLAADPVLRRYVEDKLALCWSPAQISRRLTAEFPDDLAMRVSPETIYTSLFVQAKGVLRPELTGNLRTRRVRRRPHRRISVNGRRSRIPDLVPISLRPASAVDRREPGHWEGDLLVGRYGRSHLITLVERHSRYLMVLPIRDASSGSVVTALCRAFDLLPPTMARTLTWDRGPEMTRHREFSMHTRIPVFFCDAYSPWQRGSNENMNGLLRQYFPKKTDLSLHTADAVQAVVDQLNHRPRQALRWQTPNEVYHAALVAMIA